MALGNNERGGVAGWIAIIIAVIALILAWVAFNRTGQDLEERIQREVNQGLTNVREDAGSAEENQTDDQNNQETDNQNIQDNQQNEQTEVENGINEQVPGDEDNQEQ